ncbi:MAG: hypothetical protein OXC62_11110 [Aestuariivita sp.]|nr:hypothetical protein [Aestuariivita sp.]
MGDESPACAFFDSEIPHHDPLAPIRQTLFSLESQQILAEMPALTTFSGRMVVARAVCALCGCGYPRNAAGIQLHGSVTGAGDDGSDHVTPRRCPQAGVLTPVDAVDPGAPCNGCAGACG